MSSVKNTLAKFENAPITGILEENRGLRGPEFVWYNSLKYLFTETPNKAVPRTPPISNTVDK